MIRRDSAVLLLFNDKGKFLLQHRAPTALRNPNYWGLFGGGMEGDENPLDALCREIKEELNYTVRQPVMIAKMPYEAARTDGETNGGIWHVYIEKYDESQILQQGEGQGMDWFSLEETASLLMIDEAREAVTMARALIMVDKRKVA